MPGDKVCDQAVVVIRMYRIISQLIRFWFGALNTHKPAHTDKVLGKFQEVNQIVQKPEGARHSQGATKSDRCIALRTL